MAYDETVAARVRACLGRKRAVQVAEKKMFGGLAFMVQGHMACGVLERRLMLRLGDEGTARALQSAHTRPMDFTGKPIKSMLYLEPPGFKADADLRGWVDRAVKFAQSLPPK
ncbi:MAG: TfoX/Sxy family protein [Planctomycetota bacterium]|nr:TfoX/Sxy family protein [Planctomycetota bacterium]